MEAYQLTLDDIKKTAALSICRLTADTGLPQKKITEAIEICDNIVSQILEYLMVETKKFLESHQVDVSNETTQKFLSTFKHHDLFSDVKTHAMQKAYLEKLAIHIPEPVDKCVGRRVALRHVQSVPKRIFVNETFTYIPIIETLKLIFRDPQNRLLLQTANIKDTVGIKEYSSFESGLLY